MNEIKYIYERYGVLGIAVAFIAYLLWQKRDFFLSKSNDNKTNFENEAEFPCCKRRKDEMDKLDKKVENMEIKINDHLAEADKRVLDFAQFHAAQIEINKGSKETLDRLEKHDQKIFDLLSEVKNMMIESKK